MCIRDRFNTIITDVLGQACDYDVVKNIHETLNEMLEESKEEPQPLELEKNDIKRIFEKSGVPEDKLTHFEENYEQLAGERTSLLAANIANTKKFNIETCLLYTSFYIMTAYVKKLVIFIQRFLQII